MRWIDLAHRWTGGVLGLVLAVLGLSGALLVHKESWVLLPHAADARVADPSAIASATARMLAAMPDAQSIIYASDSFGLHQIRRGEGAGAYADQAGAVVARWDSQWARPELWLFDLHHHLFAGETGEWVTGVAGLAAVLFTVTGAILWWRTRAGFRLRAWPKRMTRPAIVMHHRDLGIVAAPLLILSSLTGAMMLFKPVAALMLGTSAEAIKTANAPPKVTVGAVRGEPDWARIIAAAHARFPDSTLRIVTLPRGDGDPVAMRMKRAAEWLPNGRTTLAFEPATGRLLAAKDALALPAPAQAYNAVYPLHAAKVGGLAYRLVMTASGLAMAMLGSFAVWSFWFRRPAARKGAVRAAPSIRSVQGAGR